MNDPKGPAGTADAPEPQRPLDRAPGERYRQRDGGPVPDAPREPSKARAVLAAVLVADACALLFFALAQVDLGVGMLAVAGFCGWATGIALLWWGRDAVPSRTTRTGVAALVAGSAIVLALVLDWLWSLAQGGAMGPLAYVGERFGVVAALSVAVAAGVAALRAR